MSNLNRKKGKQQLYAIIGLVLVAAMLITTFVSGWFLFIIFIGFTGYVQYILSVDFDWFLIM